MINLLPPNSKETLVFARRNTQLIRFVIGLGIGAAGILVVIGFGMLYLQQEVNSYKSSIKQSETELKQQKEAQTIARVQDISGSLKLVVDVLEQEVLFSKLIRQIGAVMPSGTVLQSLSLSNELTGGLSLQAGATNSQAASQVLINLRDAKNPIFEEADIERINCETAADAEPTLYPCTVTLRALFGKNNNFMLLSEDKKKDE